MSSGQVNLEKGFRLKFSHHTITGPVGQLLNLRISKSL